MSHYLALFASIHRLIFPHRVQVCFHSITFEEYSLYPRFFPHACRPREQRIRPGIVGGWRERG